MNRALRAAFAYFGLIFALGFALGTIRVLAVAPFLGEAGAVLLEFPVMLAASWLTCGWLIARFGVPKGGACRLAMGGLAFGLLMIAELAVSVLGFGRTVAEHFTTYRNGASQIGLLAQLAFAAFPLLQRKT